MKKISSIAVIALVVSLGTSIAFAQEATLTAEPTTVPAPATGAVRPAVPPKGQINAIKERVKENVTANQNALKEKLQAVKQNASSTRGEVKEKAESVRAEVQNKKEEVRNNIEVKRVEMAKQWGEKTMKRLDETVLRLEKVASRIESRIAKMKAENKDTSKADTSLSAAKQKIAQAKEQIVNVKLFITNFTGQTTPTVAEGAYKPILGENIQKIKDQVRTVTESLKSAHQSLVQTITELKGKEGLKKNTASSTEATKTE